ncbi:MAG: hypothetical protein JRE47_06800 [Deltaproteobacteria bacterium]|nr:hypothetical protein [Deltaproteobacteria bacterium]
MKKILSYLIVFLCLSSTSLLAGQTVTAVGLSFFESGREVIAREKALDEARRAAIEKAVGVVVEARTIVENFEVVKDQILSRATGYLNNIKILEERKTDFGAYEVKIQADVEVSALMEDLNRFQKILSWQKNPRISIVIEPDIEKRYISAAKKTAGLLTKKLKKNGFSVFRYSKNNDIQMGLLVELSLELSTKQSNYKDIKITINEISLDANIYRPGDGEILAAAGAVKSLPGENSLQVLDRGAKSCVDAIWSELRKKLTRVWERELYSERNIYLIVKNVSSHAKAQEIAIVFKSDVSGIIDTELISFRKSMAEYNLKYRGWPEQLLNEIEMSYFKNRYFKTALEDIAGNKIVIELVE